MLFRLRTLTLAACGLFAACSSPIAPSGTETSYKEPVVASCATAPRRSVSPTSGVPGYKERPDCSGPTGGR